MFSNWKPPARTVVLALALVAITLAAWSPVLQNDFVNYDDPVYVTENPHVQGGLTWAGAAWAFRTGEGANWHPLTWLSHMLDCQLWDLRPAGHHLTSLLFHAANTLLLFLLLKRLTGSDWRSALVAALFAWHPLHVESVAWVAERKDVLSTFFGLLALGAYARYVQCGDLKSPISNLRSPWYAAALFLFALSLMSKPMLVTLPFLLLLLDYWPLARWQLVQGSKFPAAPARLLLEKLPFLALSAASCVVTFLVQQHGRAVVPAEALPLKARLLNGLLAYGGYVDKACWPVRLAVFYPYHRLSWGPVLLAAAVVAGLTLAAVLWRRRWPGLCVGWFWFVGTLVPVIGLVQVGAQAMADRYTYLPLIGLFVAVAWVLPDLLGRWKAAAGAAALLLCLILSWGQLSYWKNSETLFRHALAVTTGNYVAHGNLGAALVVAGQPREAEAQFSAALRVHPGYYPAAYALGNLARTNGSPESALAWFNRALALRPGDAQVQYNHAVMLAEMQQEDAAIAHYREALRLNPQLAPAHNNLAGLLLLQGQPDEALVHAQTALRLQPEFPQAHLNAGNALFLAEKFAQAEAHYRAALRLDPKLPTAHLRLGQALVNQDKLAAAETPLATAAHLDPANPEPLQLLAKVHAAQKRPAQALQEYRAALRLEPDWAEGMRSIAWILATHPDPKLRQAVQAVELASRAAALTGGTNILAQETLAAAYAEAGMFKEALQAQQLACLLSVSQQGAEEALALHRLELYRAGQPYREP
jgi:protein O-mannosyl-transferase